MLRRRADSEADSRWRVLVMESREAVEIDVAEASF
jgi:hypothetical protein